MLDEAVEIVQPLPANAISEIIFPSNLTDKEITSPHVGLFNCTCSTPSKNP